ncbi:MAG: hypothetical protein IT577_19375, partial [Verrucomicrobiae bacterium]|nr:hypothetical protein [Verrucomicrobiae bacterium]
APEPGGGGVFSLTCPGYPGQYCAFEESTNLLQWVPVATNQVPEGGLLQFWITNDTARPRAFYRWHRIE